MKLEGKVKEGKGEAQKFLSMKPYKQKIKQEIGFIPFPGTLNLEAKQDEIEKLKDQKKGRVIEGFEHEGKDFGGLKLYSIEIEGLEAALLDIDRADHGKEIIEIIAKKKLRDEIGLENGEEVKIHA